MTTIRDVESSLKRSPCPRLKELRAKHLLSVLDLSRFCGVSHYTILRAEMGKAIQVPDAIKIAKFFELSVEELWAAATQNERRSE